MGSELIKLFALGLLVSTIFFSLMVGEFSKESQLIIVMIGSAVIVPFLRSLTRAIFKTRLDYLNEPEKKT